eukprot:scaffold503399_cov18-Prasinocladus_malaysianus.AAC.1
MSLNFRDCFFRQTVAMSNIGSAPLSFEARVVFGGLLFGAWLSLSPASGSIKPGEQAELNLTYSAGSSIWEGQYAAKVVIESDAVNDEVMQRKEQPDETAPNRLLLGHGHTCVGEDL